MSEHFPNPDNESLENSDSWQDSDELIYGYSPPEPIEPTEAELQRDAELMAEIKLAVQEREEFWDPTISNEPVEPAKSEGEDHPQAPEA